MLNAAAVYEVSHLICLRSIINPCSNAITCCCRRRCRWSSLWRIRSTPVWLYDNYCPVSCCATARCSWLTVSCSAAFNNKLTLNLRHCQLIFIKNIIKGCKANWYIMKIRYRNNQYGNIRWLFCVCASCLCEAGGHMVYQQGKVNTEWQSLRTTQCRSWRRPTTIHRSERPIICLQPAHILIHRISLNPFQHSLTVKKKFCHLCKIR